MIVAEIMYIMLFIAWLIIFIPIWRMGTQTLKQQTPRGKRMKRFEYVPDLVLESKDRYKERLEFTLKASKVLICASVKGAWQSWVVDKKLLKGRLKL